MANPQIIQSAIDTLPTDWAYTPVTDKKPLTDNWQNCPFSKNSVIQEIKKLRWTGIGALCGVPSGGLLFLDHDGESCDQLVEQLSGQPLAEALPRTVSFTSGKPGRYQVVYRVSGELWASISTVKKKSGVRGPDGEIEQLEFRWNGCQSVVCGIHPGTKQPYRWVNSPVDTPIADVPMWMIEQMLQDSPQQVPVPEPPPKFAQVPSIAMDEIPMVKCISPKHRDLIESGEGEGGRDNAGIAVAMDLIGTEQHLRSIGQRFEGNARSLFENYCNQCSPPIAAKDLERIWKSAEKSTNGPCLSEDKIQGCIDVYFKCAQSKGDRPVLTDTEPVAPDEGALWRWKEQTRVFKAISEIALILVDRWADRISFDPYTKNFYHYGVDSIGLWSVEDDIGIKKLIQRTLQETDIGHGISKVNAVFEYIKAEVISREWQKNQPRNLLPMKNGVLNIETRELHPHSPDYRFIWQLPHEYNPLRTCEPIIEWLSQTQNGDRQRVQLLRAYLRACVTGAASLQRFLELIGPGGAGKSSYANLAIALIGYQNCYVTSIAELETNRFATAALYGKRLVSITDADGYNKTLSKFKSLIGGDMLPFERKNKDAREGFVYRGMVIYAANRPLASSDNTSGLERRRLTCPFDNQIPLGQQRTLLDFEDGGVTGEFVEHLPGLLNWVLEMTDLEMFDLVKDTAASVPSLAQAKIDILTSSNSLAGWLDDCCIFDPRARTQIGTATKQQITTELGGDRLTKSEYQNEGIWLYASYRAYCDRTGHKKPVTMRKFSDELIDLCRNQLKNADVQKERGRDGAAIVGLMLRKEGDQDSPNPISGGGHSTDTNSTPKDSQTSDEVWVSVDPSLQAEIHTMATEVFSYANSADRQFLSSFSDWHSRHSQNPKWQALRDETWRFLKSTDEGRSIARRLKSLEQKQTHSVAA